MPYLAHVANCSAALRWHTLQVLRPSAHTNLLPRFAGALWAKAGQIRAGEADLREANLRRAEPSFPRGIWLTFMSSDSEGYVIQEACDLDAELWAPKSKRFR
jgi:hypothetical protein